MNSFLLMDLVKMYQDPDYIDKFSARYDLTMRFLEDDQNTIMLGTFLIDQFREIIQANRLYDMSHGIITSMRLAPGATLQLTFDDSFVWTTTPLDFLCCHVFFEQLRSEQVKRTFLMGLLDQGSLFRASKNWLFERYLLSLILQFL